MLRLTCAFPDLHRQPTDWQGALHLDDREIVERLGFTFKTGFNPRSLSTEELERRLTALELAIYGE
jgi:hypothetical protein